MKNIMWWGYLHKNGSPQLKRWFGDHEDYRGDCSGNPFVLQVVEPFESPSREDAEKTLRLKLGLLETIPLGRRIER